MRARIYSPAKTAMQSGKSKTGHWVLEYDQAEAKRIEPLMGYTSSSNMLSQVKLRFNSKDEAVAYAKKNGIDVRIDEPQIARRRKATYSENFAYARRIPWTH